MPEQNNDFELFKSEFKKWQEKFGLSGWATYFTSEKLNEKCTFAELRRDIENMTATACLNNEIAEDNQQFKDIERSAKHEAIHLLVGRLSDCGRYRFVNEDELNEAEEELVHKLEGLIN